MTTRAAEAHPLGGDSSEHSALGEHPRRRAQEQLLESVAQAAGRLAHDLGNVFTSILGFTELSLAHCSPSQALIQSHLNELYRSAQTGARLTHQLRLFSRRDHGRHVRASLPAALAEQAERLYASAELNLDVPDSLPPVGLDSEHLDHVLSALLDNAVEATSQARNSGEEITVVARLVDLDARACGEYFANPQPGRYVCLAIADQGAGMTAEQWQRVVVELLFTTKPRHRGLGLAVVYGILCAHGGGLRLRPRPEGGVEAEILLPLAEEAVTAVLPSAHSSETMVGARVLVVDDDPMLLNFVRTTLEHAGYRVQAVSNAEDALASYAARVEPFHLVLSDVVMPGVSGLDLARRLLQRDDTVQLLFMSGHGSRELDQHDLGKRFELLLKPFHSEGLLRAVRTAIAEKSGETYVRQPRLTKESRQ